MEDNKLSLLDDLKPEWRRFVELYTRLDPKFYGNATKCYLEAYGIIVSGTSDMKYNSARNSAKDLLKKEKIIKAIRSQIDDSGFNAENADKELLFLMTQHQDLRTKLGAIKEFNLVAKRTSGGGGGNLFGNGNNISITAIFNKAEEKKREMIEC